MTPAETNGIVAGKTYRIVGPKKSGDRLDAGSNVVIGDFVQIDEDDDSEIPYFRKVDVDGARVGSCRTCINVDTTNFRDVTSAVAPVTAPAFGVYVHSGSTTFTIDRELTATQIAAVLAAAGL